VANDPTFEIGLNAGSMTLVKADLGIKRVCPSCAAHFYDLQKRPIECPKCQFTFEPESLYKQRRPRQPEPVSPVAAVERDEDDEEEVEETEDAEVEEAEVEAEAPLVIASDDDEEEEEAASPEEEAEGAGMSVVDPDAADEIEAIEDIEDEDEEEDSGLLEEVEDDEDNVAGIIDPDIAKDER
jgi:uncharacterized protein (TIGR02300 family)